jgi:hypothetical protein
MFREKYLKYKNKYLELKTQLGGDFNALNTSCKAQTKINKHHNCDSCYYQNFFEPDFVNTRGIPPNIAPSICIEPTLLYFSDPSNTIPTRFYLYNNGVWNVINDRTKFDACISSGLAIMANQKHLYVPEKKESKLIINFAKYKNEGITSQLDK